MILRVLKGSLTDFHKILVHGAKHNMTRFKSKLLSLNATKELKTKVFTPANCEQLTIPFVKDKIVKVVGRLARESHPPSTSNDNQVISGVLVRNEEHSMSLMDPADLPEYAGLPITRLGERVHVNLGIGAELIKYGLSGYFGHVEELPATSSNGTSPLSSPPSSSDTSAVVNGTSTRHPNGLSSPHPLFEDRGQLATFLVMDTVLVYAKRDGSVELSWEGNMTSDSVADAVLGCLSELAMSPAGLKGSVATRPNGSAHAHHDDDADEEKRPARVASAAEGLARLCTLLEAQFGDDNVAPIAVPRPWFDAVSMSAFGAKAATAEALRSAMRGLKLEGDRDELANGEGDAEAEVEAGLSVEEKALLKTPEVQSEIARLHRAGVLIPGFEVRSDKAVARVWLEDLSVESEGGRVWKERVQAVVKGAAGVAWGAGAGTSG